MTYFVEYPRNFANEYTVYATDDRKAFEAAVPGADRVNRREAVRLGWSRPREAKRDGEQWFGGFHTDDLSRTVTGDPLAEQLAECAAATQRMLAVVAAGKDLDGVPVA